MYQLVEQTDEFHGSAVRWIGVPFDRCRRIALALLPYVEPFGRNRQWLGSPAPYRGPNSSGPVQNPRRRKSYRPGCR